MLITVIIHVEVPLLKKTCLFGGYVGKNAKDVFKLCLCLRKARFFLFCEKKKELSSNSEKIRSFCRMYKF